MAISGRGKEKNAKKRKFVNFPIEILCMIDV